MRLTIPQQFAQKTTAELASIARATENEHTKQVAIRQLEIRAMFAVVPVGWQDYAKQYSVGEALQRAHEGGWSA